MNVTGFLTFAAVYAVAVASPGPGIAMVIARGLSRGLTHAVPFILGFALGDLVWYAIAANGLALLAKNYEGAFTAVRYAGCAYLIYLSYKIWRAPAQGMADRDSTGNGPWEAFANSLTLTLGNPKPIVFFLSIMPLVVELRTMALAEFVEVGALVLAVIIPILTAALMLANAARRLFATPRAVAGLNRRRPKLSITRARAC